MTESNVNRQYKDRFFKKVFEAKAMILEEYDEELHIKKEKAISYEDGFSNGENSRRISDLAQMLSRGGTEDDLRKFLDATEDEIAKAKTVALNV